jgi:hypothetical protein
VRALEAMSELWALLGDETNTALYTSLHTKALAGFNMLFWSDAEGFYADWVDINGKPRHYFYVEHNMLAIIFGIANSTQ